MISGDPTAMATIKALFCEEMSTRRGKVSDIFDDGRLLFLRSILPDVEEVRARDKVQGGVALRSNGTEAWVHPYIFRQVCSNGAIMAQSIEMRHIVDLGGGCNESWLDLRLAIQACAAPESFATGARRMRIAATAPVDLALSMMSFSGRLPASVIGQILRSYFGSGDNSAFGLANAITATARETADLQLRWDLEELGGGVFAQSISRPPRHDDREARRSRLELAGSATR